jgi:hypothetical protein
LIGLILIENRASAVAGPSAATSVAMPGMQGDAGSSVAIRAFDAAAAEGSGSAQAALRSLRREPDMSLASVRV